MDIDVDLHRLPIPAWGLVCPSCGYCIDLLPDHRCPECGARLEMERIVRSWTRLRAPRFRGDELPVPDFGLRCGVCGGWLAGAPRHACTFCGAGFDPAALRPRKDWFAVERHMCGRLPVLIVEAALSAARIPYYALEPRTVYDALFGPPRGMEARLFVASEFYFEFLWFVRRTQRDIDAARQAGVGRGWRCSCCRRRNPGHFEICWNCQAVRRSVGQRPEGNPSVDPSCDPEGAVGP